MPLYRLEWGKPEFGGTTQHIVADSIEQALEACRIEASFYIEPTAVECIDSRLITVRKVAP